MQRRQFLKGTVAAAGTLIAKPAIAQSTIEVSFFYPVAVGGPITKLIDTFAADFEKENPSIKLKPIYAGTYQETIVKALTAHKSGNPPTTSVLLSTDMFTLIDEDAIVPIDDFVKTDDDKGLSSSCCWSRPVAFDVLLSTAGTWRCVAGLADKPSHDRRRRWDEASFSIAMSSEYLSSRSLR